MVNAESVTVTIFTPGPGGGLSTALTFLIEQSSSDDTIAPVVVSSSPGAEASAVNPHAHIIVQFSELVLGIDSSSITLSTNGVALSSDVFYDAATR